MPTPPAAACRPVAILRHGETLIDDFAWLRDRDDPAVTEYLTAENDYAASVLAPLVSLQDRFYKEMLGRIKETDLSVSVRLNGYWYYTRTEEGKQYAIHCRRKDGPTQGREEVLVDVNVLAEGKPFLALGDFNVSDDTTRLAYSTDETGFRQYTLHLRDLATGADLPFARERVTSVAWMNDSHAFYYTIEHPETKRSYQLWHHRPGMHEDTLVYEERDEAFNVSVHRTRDRKWLLLQCGSHTTSECRAAPADAENAEWRVLLPRRADIEYDVDHHPSLDSFVIRINDTGRNFRLVRAPANDVRRATLKEVVPHRDDVMLEGHDCFADWLVLTERQRGVPQLTVCRRNGQPYRIAFPEPVYEAYLQGNPEWEIGTLRIGYQSLVTPSSVYDYDLATRERTLLKQQEIVGGYDASRFVSERLEARAADGTMIPISLVRRADVRNDGKAPCLLHGYGSYGYPYPVAFSSGRLSLLERGIVVAIAHIRGGGELGKAWHDAGRMAHKMNTFTDFISAAEHLASTRRVSRKRIAIEGGSAGGLLMGAVTNLRPDLFAAV
ncbi:MAG TPA: prolyl oligopeptidase family serine peptidase, partial [Gemmatimonadales bacterium]|nr:prolyl oligopeptidase family serine peptidase [Gemmatimonadales bacterium]